MSDSPIEIIERWEAFGGTWRVTARSVDAVEIELCTCLGEPVDVFRTSETRWLELREPGNGARS